MNHKYDGGGYFDNSASAQPSACLGRQPGPFIPGFSHGRFVDVALQDFEDVWRGLSAADTQRMALVWESQELLALNKSIMTFIKDQA